MFTDELPLFAYARTTDPETSHFAAASVDNIRESQKEIIRILGAYGPLSDEEIYLRRQIPISSSGARTRRKELCVLGLVLDSGERRKTLLGRSTIVWRLNKIEAPIENSK